MARHQKPCLFVAICTNKFYCWPGRIIGSHPGCRLVSQIFRSIKPIPCPLLSILLKFQSHLQRVTHPHSLRKRRNRSTGVITMTPYSSNEPCNGTIRSLRLVHSAPKMDRFLGKHSKDIWKKVIWKKWRKKRHLLLSPSSLSKNT